MMSDELRHFHYLPLTAVTFSRLYNVKAALSLAFMSVPDLYWACATLNKDEKEARLQGMFGILLFWLHVSAQVAHKRESELSEVKLSIMWPAVRSSIKFVCDHRCRTKVCVQTVVTCRTSTAITTADIHHSRGVSRSLNLSAGRAESQYYKYTCCWCINSLSCINRKLDVDHDDEEKQHFNKQMQFHTMSVTYLRSHILTDRISGCGAFNHK